MIWKGIKNHRKTYFYICININNFFQSCFTWMALSMGEQGGRLKSQILEMSHFCSISNNSLVNKYFLKKNYVW